ncbi:MAG: ATP-binding protein [Chromatiales bacterium]
MRRRRNRVLAAVVTLSALLLVSLVMMSDAMQNSARFSRIYSLLLVINAFGLLGFLALIGFNLKRLLRELRRRRPGARLKRRLTILFVVLAVVPVLVVYGFSLEFLRRGIDNWFDVRVAEALDDALNLSRASLDLRMRELLRQTQQMAETLTDSNGADPLSFEQLQMPESLVVENPFTHPLDLDGLRRQSGAEEVTLMTSKGAILASSSVATEIVPSLPPDTVLLQLRQRQNYIGLEPIRDSGLYMRVVVNVPSAITGEGRILQALFPVAERMTALADNVQSAFVKYRELAYLRDQLKLSFIMTLTLVLLFSIFAAVWAAFYTAQRLAEPIRDLAEGTQAVAAGNYETSLPVPSNDDIGVLVHSFNEMTRRLAQTRDEARQSRDEVERQRAYLETVLGRLSSGVLTVTETGELRTANEAAAQILAAPLGTLPSPTLDGLVSQLPHLEPLVNGIRANLARRMGDWQEQVTLFGPNGRKVLLYRGAALTGTGTAHDDHVIVFDDITALIQGQRDAAWSEVARRLAHEIKNPLTPIQLSAERLRHKYLRSMTQGDVEVLDRLTNTIIQQVETMKGMVNTFSEYARSPRMQQEPVNLNQIIESTLDLHRSEEQRVNIDSDLDPRLPTMHADPDRLRQLLNNLLANAIEAQADKPTTRARVSTRLLEEAHGASVELRVEDRGNGVAPEMLSQIFEPYVTSKPRGTGLGLAIVKKIVEEHGGIVWMENAEAGGGCAVIRLPVTAPEHMPVAASLTDTNPQGKVA